MKIAQYSNNLATRRVGIARISGKVQGIVMSTSVCLSLYVCPLA